MDENISGADLEESHFHHTIMEFCNLADKYGLDYMAYKSNDLRLELIKYMTSSDDDSYEWDDVYTGEEVYDSGMAYDDQSMLIIPPPPSCLDSAYERKAIDQGLVTKPVFPENKEYLEWKQKQK